MKRFLNKPLGLAVAAALAVGTSTTAMALVNANAVGNAAIVPYYTVVDDYVTGVHVTNTTDSTQIVKIRVRRAADSADVMDFIVAMSPNDMWTGFLSDNNDDGQLTFYTNDNSCTVPIPATTGQIESPLTTAAGDLEGYIEVIGMGQAMDETDDVPAGALHDITGEPANCVTVQTNFKAANVIDLDETRTLPSAVDTATFYTGTAQDAFKVSYFIRDTETGMEFGNNAQHILFEGTPTAAPDVTADEFGPMMANQQEDLSGNGVSFPSLEGSGVADPASAALADPAGGVTLAAAVEGRYDTLRLDLGANYLINDWSNNPLNGVSTDWVITIPGQHLLSSKDLPLTAAINVYDREEQDSLIVSPAPVVTLANEVNVIAWTDDGADEGVFNSSTIERISGNLDRTNGWAQLSLTGNAQPCFDPLDATTGECTNDFDNEDVIPVIGFAAWQRTFTDASKNYGRIINHSRKAD